MNIIKTENLNYYNYSVKILTALQQFWQPYNSFSCIKKPKEKNIFLYLDGCNAKYITKDKKIYTATSGDIIYTPVNSEYTVEFYDFSSKNSCTYGINILFFDENNIPFILSDDIVVFKADNINYKNLFKNIVRLNISSPINTASQKSDIYAVISGLIEYKLNVSSNKIVNSLTFLEDCNSNLTIEEIASNMHMSETYFRRIFKATFGVSPVKYRLEHKIKKAKLYLKHDDISISEIAELLNFTDTAYFTKMFKKTVGITPTKYKSNL